ncbi:MAG TPA: hypothetical protein VI136_27200, partial [Verrucomicrobiae bacterium]
MATDTQSDVRRGPEAASGAWDGDVPGVVENAVGGLAAKRTSLAVKSTNQTHPTHEETKSQLAGGSQHQI